MNTSNASPHVVVIGAGHAAGTLATQLRQLGHRGPITLVGDEALPPYQRPPLSKDYLKRLTDVDRLRLKPATYHGEQGITLCLNTRVDDVDTAAQTLRLHDGRRLPYDVLVLATGARARPLPEAVLQGQPDVLSLRTVADADRLQARLRPGLHVLVVGGGFIGLEAAASLRTLQCQVTVLESAPRLLARSASAPVSEHLRRLHTQHGVHLRLSARLTRLRAEAGRAVVAELADGSIAQADVVLAGIGAVPNDALARQAGLACEDGILVNEDARTSLPGVYAIGDCTQRPLPLYARRQRMESVPSAVEQARQAACHILGLPRPAPELPWFWSDQHGCKLQIAGLAAGAELGIVRGDPDAGSFAVYHLQGRRLLAVEAVNAAPDFLFGKRHATRELPAEVIDRLRDPAVDVRELGASLQAV